MNLRTLANSATQRVNANQTITWKRATGIITQDANFARTPQYETIPLQAQVQAIEAEGLRRAEVLGISGIMRTVFIYGNMHGIVRPDMKGGDLLVFPELPGEPDRSWKVFDQVMNWSGWSYAHVVLQTDDGNY